MATVSSLNEFELIARLTAGLKVRTGVQQGVGDDCAILDLAGDTQLLATCDSQVEGIHFVRDFSSPQEIGRKALAINLSDIAAMGGEPRYALVSLVLPATLPLEIVDGIYAGLRYEAEQFATAIVGGNISGAGKSAQLIIDITLLGSVERGRALTRDGARAGDLLCVTGTPGASAAGLFTLLHPALPYPEEARQRVRAIHTTPRPRVREGRVLNRLGSGVVTAMLDVSDGLSGDLAHLCERSRVGACVDLARLPLSPETRAIAAIASRDPLHWALHGGEDYELLFTIAPTHESSVIEAVQAATGTPVTVIGTILPPDEGMQQLLPSGERVPLPVESWDHMKS